MPVFEVLKKLRKERKLTQEQVSSILKIKRPTYASYETPRVNIDTDLLQKLAGYYSITIESILDGSAIGEEKANFKVKRRSEDEFVGVTIAEMAAIKSALKILKNKVVYLEKKLTKKPYDEKISRNLEKDMKEEYNHILDELQQK